MPSDVHFNQSQPYAALDTGPLNTDPSFCQLTLKQQGMEVILRRDPKLSPCGVVISRERFWALHADGLTQACVQTLLTSLATAGRLVIDDDFGEVFLVGHLIRHRGLRSGPTVGSILKAATDITSPVIRQAVGQEMAQASLDRLSDGVQKTGRVFRLANGLVPRDAWIATVEDLTGTAFTTTVKGDRVAVAQGARNYECLGDQSPHTTPKFKGARDPGQLGNGEALMALPASSAGSADPLLPISADLLTSSNYGLGATPVESDLPDDVKGRLGEAVGKHGRTLSSQGMSSLRTLLATVPAAQVAELAAWLADHALDAEPRAQHYQAHWWTERIHNVGHFVQHYDSILARMISAKQSRGTASRRPVDLPSSEKHYSSEM